MGVSKVEFGGDTLIDLTSDTVTPETLAEGETAHNAAGEEITGTLKVQDEIVTTTGTGEIYEVTVRGITALKNGVSFVMIPHETNTNNFPKLNVNGLGEINIWRRISTGGFVSVSAKLLLSGVPYRVVFCENMLGSGYHIWELVDIPKPVADDLNGTVPVANGGVPFYLGQKKGNVLAIGDSGTPEWQEPTGGGSGGGSGGTTIKYSEGLEFEDYEEGYAVIGIGTCTDEDVLIPPEHEGMPVFEIGEGAFEDYSAMKSLYIPKTVTVIMSNIFPAETVHIYCESKSKPDGWSDDWNWHLHPVEWGYVLGGGTSGSNSGGSLQMPQIRFANFQKVELWDEETETLSTRYRFTVENLGGGTLQVGDKLQICCRRKYPNGKKKLRRMADIEITENDLNQRFLKIEVDPEDESVQKWLFRNDRNQSSVTTLSAMYFRLKRVTKYSDSDGMECNAIFSNVEQVWKTYILPCNGGWELNIK